MALQRNLKALGTFGYQTTGAAQSRLHPVHPAHAEVRAREPATSTRASRRLARRSWRPCTCDGAAMTTFGLSTHLFHGERLERRHLETHRRRTASTSSSCSRRARMSTIAIARVSASSRGWLARSRDDGCTACTRRSATAFATASGDAPYSNASTGRGHRQEAIDETRAALDAARELGCQRRRRCTSACRAARRFRAGDNDAGRRAAEPRGDRRGGTARRRALALEVIPNELSTPAALADLLERRPRARRRRASASTSATRT